MNMTENEILKDLQNYQGILKAKTRINAGVNPEIALNAVTEAIDIIEQYRAIGTIEEFKALKEKSEPKKVLKRGDFYKCPVCNHWVGFGYGYCDGCGQKLDWSE